MNGAYHQARLVEDPRRDTLWRALWRYFFKYRITPEDTVLDLGAGYGNFINAVVARRRIALDSWSRMPAHLAREVEAIVAPATDLSAIALDSIDFAFASNLLEHLEKPAIIEMLAQLAPRMTKGGSLTLLQPNYRYASREYFDDYTHVSIFSHVGLADFLEAHGWQVTEIRPRFLPLTVKSRLPIRPWLIRLYLASPIKPFGKQMLLVAKPRHDAH